MCVAGSACLVDAATPIIEGAGATDPYLQAGQGISAVPSSFHGDIADLFVACSLPVLIVNAGERGRPSARFHSINHVCGSSMSAVDFGCASGAATARIKNDDSSGLCSCVAPKVNARDRGTTSEGKDRLTFVRRPNENGRANARPFGLPSPARAGRVSSIVESVDVAVLGLGDEDETDHEGHEGDDDRIPEPEIDIAGLRHHGGR